MPIFKTWKKVAVSSAILSAFTAGAAVAQSPAELDPANAAYYEVFKDKNLAFISILAATDHSKMYMQEMKRALEPLGMSIELRDINLSTTAGTQAFTQAITEKPELIVAWNPDFTAYARLIQQATNSGIHVVSLMMNSRAKADAYVGPDWVQMGRMQINGAIKACEGKSNKIAIIQGNVNSGQNVLEMAAINEILASHPEIQVVANQQADWDPNKAKPITDTILRQHPDICAVLGSTESQDYGIAAAVEEAGLTDQVWVSTSGIGRQDGACDQVAKGVFDQYIMYHLEDQALQLTTTIKTILSSGLEPGQMSSLVYTPLFEITPDNAETPGLCWTW